jgi:hypothetical protein
MGARGEETQAGNIGAWNPTSDGSWTPWKD